MHILITDSGVGGLSVCAYAERFVRARGFAEPVRLTFANAAPANDSGYNAMPNRAEKLRTFDRFLRNVTARFAPDSIYVACNTLSVLLPDTPFFARAPVPLRGIVETGAALLAGAMAADPRRTALIFGTQTTIEAGAYPRLLAAQGIDASRIVSQACPGLADVISEDREGARTAAEIRRWVNAALAKRVDAEASGAGVSPAFVPTERRPPGGGRDARTTPPAIAFLACTHYGYRADLFSAAFDEAGVGASVIDPNERAVDDLFGPHAESRGNAVERDVEVQVVTRYAIPPATVDTLTFFLGDIAPATVAAVRNFIHVPDLF